MKEALFYTKLKESRVKCELCPWNCILNIGQTGNCRVRTNRNGILTTEVYNKVAAVGSDPIEKKPLYHFYPGTTILSIGEVGCNLHCSFCQNHRISQCEAKQFSGFSTTTSQQTVNEALKSWNNIGVAYTYNEPFTFYEFMLETAEKAKAADLKNVVISNGYINTEPLQRLIPYIDAFNIDLKAFSEKFYQKYTKGKMHAVLETLKTIANSQKHLEITNLVIPELNDNPVEFEEMVKWIASELGKQTPLHLSRYYPQYKMNLSSTPIKTLTLLYDIAKQHLQHVYLGNVSDVERSSTYCPVCGEILVTRNRYHTELSKLTDSGNCKKCGTPSNIIL
uniref:AmmeMemoRadiSam system radical SAM enzyme n=1 Tax=uncultured Draconibacterium sp. TaxID=1573823 RepID=UPI00321658A3